MSDQAQTQVQNNKSKTSLLDCFYSLVTGIALTTLAMTIYNDNHNSHLASPSFPDAVRIRTLDFYETATHPTDIELKIESPAQIKKEAGEDSVAYALISHNPCIMVIPSNMRINAWPQLGYAWFKNSYDSDTIAHELLHCMVGG